MGFFSWDCKSCGHPLLAPQATNKVNAWMNRAVAIMPDGSLLKGRYDGYGRLNDRDFDTMDPEVYHATCWEKADRPTNFTSASRSSRDQGWFFDDGAHDLREEDAPSVRIVKTVG